MRNKTNIKVIYYHTQYKITPSITTIAIPLLIGRTEKIIIGEQPSQKKSKETQTEKHKGGKI